MFQALDTIGGYDLEHFQIDDNHYLAVANSYDGVKTRMDSVIYQWILSNFVPLQYIEVWQSAIGSEGLRFDSRAGQIGIVLRMARHGCNVSSKLCCPMPKR